MFLGQYCHTVDDKGRLTLPAKFRGQLASGIVITRGLDGCLFVFDRETWDQFTSILSQQLPFTTKSARAFSRFLFSGAADLEPDRQGRILIPPYLREYAGLDSEVMVIGANTRLELWDPQRWQDTLLDVESNAEQIAEQFGSITF
jgi:MraZ protein